jgi:hypothetical protein
MVLDTKYNSARILGAWTFSRMTLSIRTISITIEICSTQRKNNLHSRTGSQLQ